MTDLAYTLKVFRQIGLIAPALPHRLLGAGIQLVKWGPGFPSGVLACAARFPHQTAIVDDEGSLTWRELSEQINQLTDALRERGVGAGDSVALLARPFAAGRTPSPSNRCSTSRRSSKMAPRPSGRLTSP